MKINFYIPEVIVELGDDWDNYEPKYVPQMDYRAGLEHSLPQQK